MTILSIDPSISTMGYAIFVGGTPIDHGFYRTYKGNKAPDVLVRLVSIKSWITERIEEFSPDLVIVEEQIIRNWTPKTGKDNAYGNTYNIRNLIMAYTATVMAVPPNISLVQYQPSQWMRRRNKDRIQAEAMRVYGASGNHNGIDALMMAHHHIKATEKKNIKPKQRSLF